MHELRRTGWRAAAACAGIDTEIFYPEPSNTETKAPAKAVCARCLVRVECLVEALATKESFGIRGGLTARERRTMVKRLRDDVRRGEPRAPAAITHRLRLVAAGSG